MAIDRAADAAWNADIRSGKGKLNCAKHRASASHSSRTWRAKRKPRVPFPTPCAGRLNRIESHAATARLALMCHAELVEGHFRGLMLSAVS